jgi:hypothetical protein
VSHDVRYFGNISIGHGFLPGCKKGSDRIHAIRNEVGTYLVLCTDQSQLCFPDLLLPTVTFPEIINDQSRDGKNYEDNENPEDFGLGQEEWNHKGEIITRIPFFL